jgi:hypothetical protein
MSVGDMTVEVKITDAATGELLADAVDQRVGGINIKGAWDSWMTAGTLHENHQTYRIFVKAAGRTSSGRYHSGG